MLKDHNIAVVMIRLLHHQNIPVTEQQEDVFSMQTVHNHFQHANLYVFKIPQHLYLVKHQERRVASAVTVAQTFVYEESVLPPPPPLRQTAVPKVAAASIQVVAMLQITSAQYQVARVMQDLHAAQHVHQQILNPHHHRHLQQRFHHHWRVAPLRKQLHVLVMISIIVKTTTPQLRSGNFPTIVCFPVLLQIHMQTNAE